MRCPLFSKSAKWLCSAALLAGVFLAVRGAAQDAPAPLGGSGAAIDKTYREGIGRFEKLAKGEEPPTAGDQKLIEATAQRAIWRVTWHAYQNKRGGLNEVVKELESQVNYTLKSPEFLKVFTAQVIPCFQEVFKRGVKNDRIGVVGAALLLPVYAKTKDEAFGDYLAKMLTDEKQHLAIRLYAVKGLREYFPVRAHHAADEATDKKLQERIARDRVRVQALLTFLGRKWEGTADVSPAAARFIRREAIATLARVDAPAMKVVKDKVDTPAAYELLRVLAGGKSSLSPTPSLAEKCEAAIGICQLLSTKEKNIGMNLIEEYQPDVGVYLVGQFLVEFTKEYIQDYQVFAAKGKEGKVPKLPWKVEATRLDQALKTLQETTKESPVKGKVAAIIAQCDRILDNIRFGKRVQAATQLQKAVSTTRPASGVVYRGAKDWQIDLTAPAEGD